MHSPDVPSPIDLRLPSDASEWERTALAKRPWRTKFFQCFAEQISGTPGAIRILELGSGPGFLAAHLLACFPQAQMVLLDYSEAMHALARARLSLHLARVQFVERSFKEPGWSQSLGSFDFVVTNQAIHELRHKRYVQGLHEQVLSLLARSGRCLVCDHYAGDGGMANGDLYMTPAEQREALVQAGFCLVTEVKCEGGLVLHSASAA